MQKSTCLRRFTAAVASPSQAAIRVAGRRHRLAQPLVNQRQSPLICNVVRNEAERSLMTQERWFSVSSTHGDGTDGQAPSEPKQSSRTGRFTDIQTVSKEMLKLVRSTVQLGDLSPPWEVGEMSHHRQDPARIALFQRTNEFVHDLVLAVKERTLGGGRSSAPSREVSHLLGQALGIYAQTAQKGAYDQCRKILDVLRTTWRMDLQPSHYDHIIQAAVNEELWQEAAEMFQSSVDPEVAGYTPFVINIANPVGLYAIAKNASDKDLAVADNVMDAVMNMTMVSPQDQRSYVLAAGTALGQAGEYQALIDYQKTSLNASSFGQPLVAAAMYACYLCGRADVALELFYKELVDGPLVQGGEHQWAGGASSLDPLCRDVALRVMPGRAGQSANAIKLLRDAMDDGFEISLEAILGVMQACELDGSLEDSLFVLQQLCGPSAVSTIVDGSLLSIEQVNLKKNKTLSHPLLMAKVLASFARTCHLNKQYGLAWTGLSLFEHSAFGATFAQPDSSLSNCFPLLHAMAMDDEFLLAAATNLHGLPAVNSTAAFYGHVRSLRPVLPPELVAIRDYVANNGSDSNSLAGWDSASMYVSKLVRATQSFNVSKGLHLEVDELRILLNALAMTMNACTAASEYSSAILLRERVEELLDCTSEEQDGVTAAVSSFLGFQTRQSGESILNSNDAVVAATMRLLRELDDVKRSCALYNDVMATEQENESDQIGFTSKFPLSTTEAVASFGRQNIDHAIELFYAMNPQKRDSETFLALTRALVSQKRIRTVIDVFRLAVRNHGLTDELAMLTMKEIYESGSIDGKVKLLAKIVLEMAIASGAEKNSWMEARYWSIKRQVGWGYTKRLFWWKNETAGVIGELALALHQFEARRESGLKAKNVVVRTIVRHSRRFIHDISLQQMAMETEMEVPRSREDWIRALMGVLNEIKYTNLWDDANFIEELALSLHHYGAETEFKDFLSDSASRGVPLTNAVLSQAMSNTDPPLSDGVKLAMTEGHQSSVA